MASSVCLEDARGRFEAALKILNYSERCRTLGALGKEIRTANLPEDRLVDFLDGLAGGPSESHSAFVEKARLIVANAARCKGYASKFLDHSSQTVKFAASRSTKILSASEARTAFLSNDSSRKVKVFLVGCPSLPSDDEVLQHAYELFGSTNKKRIWEMLLRVEDEAILKTWLADGSDMKTWLDAEDRAPPGLPQLVKRFPQFVVKLVKDGTIRWGWYWVKDILDIDAALVLRAVFMDGQRRGSGPRKGYNPSCQRQPFVQTVAAWAWRRKPDLLMAIIGEIVRSERGGDFPLEILDSLMGSTSTRHALTTRKKLQHFVAVWSLLPDVKKDDCDMALRFVERLPGKIREERASELQQLIEAGWTIVDTVSRDTRRTLLVGKECKDVCPPFVKQFLMKMPPRLAVEQFFRILNEFEAPTAAYKFMVANVCASQKGLDDLFMQRLFERFLQKEGVDPVSAADMFVLIRSNAKSRDVIQSTFNYLNERLDGITVRGLLEGVVERMAFLEQKSLDETASDDTVPPSALPLPLEWVRFLLLPKDARPHADFVLRVLHSGMGEGSLLSAMLGVYGRAFFWDSMDMVLKHGRALKGNTLLKLKSAEIEELKSLATVRMDVLLTPVPEQVLSSSPSLLLTGSSASLYFEKVGEVKKKGKAKDSRVRVESYEELMSLAKNDREQTKAFGDLLPHLVHKFNAETDVCVKTQMLRALFEDKDKALPEELWEPNLAHLKSLRKMCSKSRESGDYSAVWKGVGKRLVVRAFESWEAGCGPTEACTLGLEFAGDISLPALLVEVAGLAGPAGGKKDRLQGDALASAACWVLQTAVPLQDEVGETLHTFWTTLQTLTKTLPPNHRGAERALWNLWPFVQERWRALLSQTINQVAAEYVLVGSIKHLLSRQKAFKLEGEKEEQTWWEPLSCTEYASAVEAAIGQIESGEIPAKEGSKLLVRRVEVLLQQDALRNKGWVAWPRKRRARVETVFSSNSMPVRQWVEKVQWDSSERKRFTPLPWQSYQCRDSVAELELKALLKLLQAGVSQRNVLWTILDVAAMLSGPEIAHLVGEAIAVLDPLFEGRARCVSRHYPYLNSALSKKENGEGTPDILTPLVEIWLLEDLSRDSRVGRIMERSDCQLFLFFGTSFARHLSNKRQEWLHKCLLKLIPAGETETEKEFYHYRFRGPLLRHVGQFGPGWRRAAERIDGMDSCHHVPLSVQMYLWHETTQAAFLKTALQGSTEAICISMLPRLEYAQGIDLVSTVLAQYPREQTSKDTAKDCGGWSVIQAAGAYSDIGTEVHRRFFEFPPPSFPDAVDDPEVEILLMALGRADDAAKALTVLGQYAGKVKQAKEGMSKMICQLSPPRARELIRAVMLPKQAGVGLQVAGLKKIVELQIPNPLELYRTSWCKGSCHRDVAGIILGKAATSPEFGEEEVRDFFAFFDRADRQEDVAYVASFVLDQLIATPEWKLSFLPSVVGKLALLPTVTVKAVDALKSTKTYPTEVLQALTGLLRDARLAKRLPSLDQGSKDKPEAQLLGDLTATATCAKVRSILLELCKQSLDECDPATLQVFVDDALEMWEESLQSKEADAWSLLDSTLLAWGRQLRPFNISDWPGVLTRMSDRVSPHGGPRALLAVARVVVNRVRGLGLIGEDRDVALSTTSAFLGRILDVHLSIEGVPAADENETDSAFSSMYKIRKQHREELVLKCWAELLAVGCVERETDALFARCPEGKRLELARAIVSTAVAHERRKRATHDGDHRYQTTRPSKGWQRSGGLSIADVRVGSEVSGVVTNSSAACGVFINFGCVKDGRLLCPEADWQKYRVGTRIDRMLVKDVKEGNDGKGGTKSSMGGRGGKGGKGSSVGGKEPKISLMLLDGGGGRAELSRDDATHVARWAVRWLAAPQESRDGRIDTLLELWASIAALESDGARFRVDLELFGEVPLAPKHLVSLVEHLLKRSPEKMLIREALTFLGERCPEHAVRLWPALLTPNAGLERVEVGDMQALVRLCEDATCRLPEVKDVVARGLSDEVLEVLCVSRLAEARLLVVQALQERSWKANELPSKLRELRNDPSHVVRLAANQAWSFLGGKKEEVMEEEDEEA
eukprot:TRINITY_DN18197_c0_g1_i1.p1 TRINITY_DN18197_c0_g1~~TRINITY_DN18197_c0_g1_i1.p1  ORF type:complete len:2091 (+),score=348.88 TRINITY_DN18197_c0_g1_i1:101-6373(+)